MNETTQEKIETLEVFDRVLEQAYSQPVRATIERAREELREELEDIACQSLTKPYRLNQ